jgi:hypothetical protein
MNSTHHEEEQAIEPERFRWLPYLVFLGVTIILAVPILKDIGNWGIRDWDLFTTLHAAAVQSIVEFGQFPFWNPYIGGGNILFAHPEVPILNPVFGLLLIFGPLIGLKLQVLVMYFIGFIGCYKLARQLGMSIYAGYIVPLVYMLSSYLTLHFAAGHIPFHYFAVLPWLILFYKKSLDRPIHILSAGAVVAFIILGSGAAVPLLFSLLFLFLFSLFDIGKSTGIRPPVHAILAGISGVLFAAVKFFPMYDYLTRHPWIPEGTVQTTPLWIFPSMFFHFNQSIFANHIEGYVWGWHEYGAFVGPIVIILVAIGAILRFKNDWPYLAIILISLTLVMGSFRPPFSPWDLLHKLPGFESIRVPSRFSLLALFCFAILAGGGVDRVLSLFKYRKATLTTVIFLAILGTHLFVCYPILSETFTRKPEKPKHFKEFKQVTGDPNQMYAAFLANRGTIKAAWLSAYRHGRGIMSYDNRPAEWFAEENAVRVLKRYFTPNRIKYEVMSAKGGKLIVSQGFDTGWRRTDEKEIESKSDLITLQVVPEDREIEIYYFPDYFILGFWISLLSILLAIGGPILARILR